LLRGSVLSIERASFPSSIPESPVIRFRAFRNGDPPALADLWNRGVPERAVVRPLSPHEFDERVLSKFTFEAEGLILAEDEGRLLGFVHAGFGPESTCGPSRRLDRELGTIAMLVVDPDVDDPSLELGLMVEAEKYLLGRGAKVLYSGGQAELSSFYWGVYGGSECSGVLETHRAFVRASKYAGYEPVAITLLLEADLSSPEFRDPKWALIRRQARVEIVEDAVPANWWEALALGNSQITRFRVLTKAEDRELARASTWDMAAFGRLDGKTRTGLIDVEVTEGERRKGYGRFLIGEIFRHCRSQWCEVVSIQTRSTNLAALALYEGLGFDVVDRATLYRHPGSRHG
jgi:ribosomal protein S18 acetylase RimI-like enzyme